MFLSPSKGPALLAVLALIFGILVWFPVQVQADDNIFDPGSYGLGDTITLTINDNAMNITTGPDLIVAGGHLYSSTDMTGIYLDLSETGDSTGVFTASALVTIPGDTGAGKIPCAPGDTLAFTYTDGSASGSDTATIVTPVLGWSGSTFTEAAADNGSIGNSLTLTLTNDSFAVPAGVMTNGVHYETANVPAGLSVVITGTSSSTATVQLSGNASSHSAASSVANMRITFKDAAFTWGQASRVTGYSQSSLAVNFTSSVAAPAFVSAETNGSGSIVYVSFSKAMGNPSGKQAQFTVNDGAANAVSSIALKSGDSSTYALRMSRYIDEGDTVTVAYSAGDATAADGSVLASFAAQNVANRVDDTPSATYSGITRITKGTRGSDRVNLEITVQNSHQAGLEGYGKTDFEVVIDNSDEYLDFNDSEFGSFSDEGNGLYLVSFYGDEPATSYELDLWVDGIKIENDRQATTPSDDDDDDEDEQTYSLSSREKTIRFFDLELYIPVNAWDYDDTEITLGYSSSHSTSSLQSGQKFASDVYTISKDRSGYFDRDLTITISFEDYNIDQNRYTVSIYWYNSSRGKWEELDSVDVNWYAEECSGEIDHFTKFALIADEIPGSDSSTSNNNNTSNDFWTGNNTGTPTSSTSIWDISGHWAESYIRALVNAGIIEGEPDGSFKPAKLVTRAEFSVLLVRAFNLRGSSSLNYTDTRNHWAREYIATAVDNGVMQGYNSSQFGPDDLISREQMAAAIANTIVMSSPGNGLNFRDSGDISPWAYNAVAACSLAGIISGDQNNFFRPLDFASKAEAATIIFRAWE